MLIYVDLTLRVLQSNLQFFGLNSSIFTILEQLDVFLETGPSYRVSYSLKPQFRHSDFCCCACFQGNLASSFAPHHAKVLPAGSL